MTTEHVTARRAWLGASDLAAILGVSRYANAADIYWRKVAELERQESAATERGRYMERSILDWFEDRHEVKLQRDVLAVCADDPLFTSQLDGQMPDGTPVEAKTAASDDEWGAEYTSEIPDEYIVQAHGQMLCTGATRCYVPALVGGYNSLELREYFVPRNEGIIEACRTRGRKFWDEHVAPRIPPDDTPKLATVRRIRRQPESTTVIESAAALAEYEAAAAAAKAAAEAKEVAQARLLALLGEHEAAMLPDGRWLRFMEQASATKVDAKLLKAKWPDIAAVVCREGKTRVMRIGK